MTSYNVVYDAFKAKILEDEWELWEETEVEMDLRQLLEGAISYFKFPRVPLDRDDDGFKNELGSEEIQILANYMKCEWIDRCIATWENLKALYTERDFSPGNVLDKLVKTLSTEREDALRKESIYYRSIKGKPFKYSKMAGGVE